MSDVATLFPPQTYSSSFFLNALGEEEESSTNKKTRSRVKRSEESSKLLDCFVNRMLHLIFVLALSFESTLAQSECVDAPNRLSRTFKSLVDYQGNKLTFNPMNKDFQGNIVQFNKGVPIQSLPKNAFYTFESQLIRELSVSDHQVELIQDGAFTSLNCVSTLQLARNKISLINPDSFEGLRHLHELDLGENQIVEIPERIFRFSTLLKKLNISRNNLKVLHPDSFYKLTNLEELDLSYNYLYKIQPDTLRYFDKLKNLQIGSNQFDYLEMEKWTNLTSLRTLNVSNNELRSVDFVYSFSFSSSLTELYLDDNYLTKFNVRGFRKHLPRVTVIDISENLWMCADLVEILKFLNDSRIEYRGTETTDPNFGGIACNRTVEEYQGNKNREPETAPSTTTTTTTVKPGATVAPPVVNEQTLNSLQVLDSIKSLQTTVVCLFVVIVVFIFIEFATRCKWRRFRRYSSSPVLDNASVEDISLLRGRF
ncbi:leucine-rich repeat transmembrane neuronal protein 1-like isoform X1 [Photinus pyralis]|nr:leucine-rich repeat transmembrane neuronal protein 1-like isoform X1 [Photinus pyralis]